MKKLIQGLCLSLISISAYAQITNDSLEYRIRPDSVRTGSLYLSVNNFNYLRNYEFYNHFQDGYTLYGLQLEPQLVYYVHPQLAIMGGIHVRKDFGGEGIYKTYPLFSIKYQKDNFAFINGVLEGNVHHRFIEPLFDVENRINNPVEYGTQFLFNKPSLFLDAFINWRRMIYKPSPQQEQILAGVSSDIRLLADDNVRLSLPLQLTIFHQGGQIDTLDKPIQTLLNTATGFRFEYKTNGFVQKIRTENYFVYFNELSNTPLLPYPSGKGVYLNGGIDTRYGSLTGSYWNANGYFSPLGMPLFQSVSQKIYEEGQSRKHRQLLFIRYAFQQQLIPHFYIDVRLEPVMDLDLPTKKFELYHSLFLVYKQDFKLFGKKSEK
ncbi:hypothetical protein FW774_18660 [Pedobacter sp. BS3]|uniref:hypothetical protein n=1 Tax=Pedobacter sp. BS3 TaxID=2567937 RepID=UPI0011F0221C|nr:hypothetical protein [Pedobacter sp. BS3]TZF81296.1 hypothetical protein FW774_18660 [Pedobacter sp. BS3]